jgi:nickel-dependent lactate racemase
VSAVSSGGVAHDLDSLIDRVAALSLHTGCEVQRETPPAPAPIDVASVLARELAAPTGSSRLANLARGRESVAIVTSDMTRAVPNGELLPQLLAELAQAGVDPKRITVVFGGGAHRPMRSHEMRDLLGPALASTLRLTAHDSRKSECAWVGRTPLGNDVRINTIVAEADLVIGLGVVEAHEFAGFGGGRKAILPGVAAYETIVHNHSIALLDDEAARPGVLAGNPIHEEMLWAARRGGLEFIVNVVLDARNRVVALAAGDPEAAHARLVEFVRATQTLPAIPRAHILVTGPDTPGDINFYQSIKALVALEPLADQETTVVFLSRCPEGLGSEDMVQPFIAATDPESVMHAAAAEYTVEKDHSYLLARFLTRCRDVIAWCPGVAPAQLESMGFEIASSPEDAMTRAIARQRDRHTRPRVLLFPRPQRALLAPTPADARPSTAATGRST